MNVAQVAAPVIRKRKWPYPLIWALPVLTALGAGLYFRDYLANKGPEVVIEFTDAGGLRAGETKLLYRGAEVGRVTEIELSDNHRKALVHAEFTKNEDVFATKGASFWIVRPEVSESGLSGLGTLFSGPYISALPGKDDEVITEAVGLSKAPKAYEEGEHFVLTTPRMGHVQEGSGVYYKGIQVGDVQSIELSTLADHLDVHIVVHRKFAPLVKMNSRFWVTSGFDFQAGLFSGAHLKLDSMKTLVGGGVGFATPDKDMGPDAKPGTHFALEDDPKKEWDLWSPKIAIGPHASSSESQNLKPVELPIVQREKGKKKN